MWFIGGQPPRLSRRRGFPKPRYRENWIFSGSLREGRIEALYHNRTSDMSWWQRVDRWRLGNLPVRVFFLTLMTFIVGLAAQWFIFVKLFGHKELTRSWLTGLVGRAGGDSTAGNATRCDMAKPTGDVID